MGEYKLFWEKFDHYFTKYNSGVDRVWGLIIMTILSNNLIHKLLVRVPTANAVASVWHISTFDYLFKPLMGVKWTQNKAGGTI